MILAVLGEILQDGSFCYVLHDGGHLINGPSFRPKIEAAAVELPAFFIVEIRRIQLAEHGHGRYAVQNRGIRLEITPIAKAHKGENAFAHECCTKTDEILAEPFDSIPPSLLRKSLLSAKVIRSLILHFCNENGIAQFVAGLSLYMENAPIWADRTAVKVVAELSVRIGVPKLCDDILQMPLLFVNEDHSLREFRTDVINNLK